MAYQILEEYNSLPTTQTTSRVSVLKLLKLLNEDLLLVAPDSHIFLLRHSAFLVYTTFKYSKLLNNTIGFGSNQIVTICSIQSIISNIHTSSSSSFSLHQFSAIAPLAANNLQSGLSSASSVASSKICTAL